MAFESFAKVRRDPALLDFAKSINFNEEELRDRIRAEADGTPTWARWEPSLTGFKGDLALQVDVDLAISNALALST